MRSNAAGSGADTIAAPVTSVRVPDWPVARRPGPLVAATSAVVLAATVLPSGGAAADAAVPQPTSLEAALGQALDVHPAAVGSIETVAVNPATGATSVHLDGGGIAQIELPFVDAEPVASSLDAHSTSFHDEVSGTTAVVQPLLSNGVRMIITMGTPASPTRFEFDLGDSSQDLELSMAPNGGVQVSDDTGGEVGFIDPPWAMDANGQAVPTHYELDGRRLVQVVDHHGAAYPVIADPSFQGDCGYATCTLRFNRARTRDARDASWLIGAAGSVCAVISGGTLALVCGAAVAPAAVVLAVAAGRYYEDGDCLKIKFARVGGVAWPERLNHGDYNCTGK